MAERTNELFDNIYKETFDDVLNMLCVIVLVFQM